MGHGDLASRENLLEVGPIFIVLSIGCISKVTQPEVGAAMLRRAWTVLLMTITRLARTHGFGAVLAQRVEGRLALVLDADEAVP